LPQVIARAVKELGGLDILVNNAAHQASFKSIEDISDEEWQHNLRRQRPCDVLPNQGGCAAYDKGRRYHQHRLDHR
jgi:hypothetical protein